MSGASYLPNTSQENVLTSGGRLTGKGLPTKLYITTLETHEAKPKFGLR
jgi:hypothetical protein